LEANPKSPTILVIDDDAEIRYSLTRVLSSRGYSVSEAASGELGIAMVKKGPPPDLVFLDIRMTGMSGLEALQHIRSINPKQLIILMTAFGTAQTAIEAMKYGALDYVMKPFDPRRVLSLAENALKTHADLRAVGDYKPTINTEDYKEGIVGSSSVMQEVFKVIGQVTASDVTVMITGESGTGKELVARSIWKHSHRRSSPSIARRSQRTSLKASSSGTRRARSPAPRSSGSASSSSATGARSSWTRSATWPWRRRPRSYASCSRARSSASAAPRPYAWTCASSPRRTRTSRRS
jgi:DNA-binding NtrC family response regulator